MRTRPSTTGDLEEQLHSMSLNEGKPKSLRLTCGSFYRSKQHDRKQPGEDAHFICPEKNAIGVADGVGGWTSKGIDAGDYARHLMRNSLSALFHWRVGRVDPKRVLQRAHANTKVPGTSTACILALSNLGTLTAANVGDSGFMVFRDWKLVYQSPVQHHGFNQPYQLGRREDTSVAQTVEMSVQAGDIIVAGTDGLLDNLYAEEIELAISDWKEGGSNCPKNLAERVGTSAWTNSKNESYRSPFEITAGLWGQTYTGGKVDDITVVVGLVEGVISDDDDTQTQALESKTTRPGSRYVGDNAKLNSTQEDSDDGNHGICTKIVCPIVITITITIFVYLIVR